MNKPIATPMPADLPENWTDNQFVSPGGTEVGLSKQHGYNYQSKQINDSQKAINLLNEAFLNAYGRDNRDFANEDILLASVNTAPVTDLPTNYPKGVRVYLETPSGQFPNKPSEYGLIFSIRNDDEVSQLWFTQTTGTMYYRGGNQLGWASDWISLSNKADVVNGTVLSENADYAEVGEWADGNESDEDRIGYFVAVDPSTAGTTMVKATSTMDVRGVTVAAPAFSDNCATDKFDSAGNLLKQYDFVAVMGLVSVIDNGTCTINGRCMPSDDGTAVPSTNNMGYQVIDRIDSTHVLISVEPGADMLNRIKADVSNLYNEKLRVYKSLSELGLTEATATPVAIAKAMADNSVLYHSCSGTIMTDGAIEAPVNYGFLEVHKRNSSYCSFSMKSAAYPYGWRAYYNGGAPTVKWSGWEKAYSDKYKPSASDIGAVPTSRKVNGKALSDDIALSASDVGAQRVYTSLDGLGLTESTATPEAIATAMEANSRLIYASGENATTSALALPEAYCHVEVIKVSGSYVRFKASNRFNAAGWEAYYNSGASTKWTGWQKVYSEQNKPTADDVGAARIAYGSYVGTGTYGSENMNSIALPFIPKLLIVSKSEGLHPANGYDGWYTGGFIWTYGTNLLPVWNNNVTIDFDLSTGLKTIRWFSNGPTYQANESGVTYYYTAIGDKTGV